MRVHRPEASPIAFCNMGAVLWLPSTSDMGNLTFACGEDPRVDCRERTNARHLEPGSVVPPAELVVADMSFISLVVVVPSLVSVSLDDAEFVLLVKPQFEAERSEVNRGNGVIRDPRVWSRVIEEVAASCSVLDLGIMGVMASPLRGPTETASSSSTA